MCSLRNSQVRSTERKAEGEEAKRSGRNYVRIRYAGMENEVEE